MCVTGLDQARRPALQQKIEGAGGSYSKDLVPEVTHLVALSANSDKYRMATRWPKTHIVTLKWLNDSIAAGARQNETKYPVQPNAAAPAAKADRGGRDASGRAAGAGHAPPRDVNGGLASTAPPPRLASLRLLCCGMDAEEMTRARVLCRQIGCTRLEDLASVASGRPGTTPTHVILGR